MSQQGDPIRRLPTNASAAPADEALVNHLFGGNEKAVANYLKTPLLVAAIIGAMGLPFTNELIEKFIPAAKDSPYTALLVKMLLGAVLFYVLNNWALARA